MIKLLVSEPGMGKTKEMIAHANAALATAKGSVIFIGESDESVLEIKHEVRYVNISEYPIESSNEFVAFLYGLMGGNYDIETVYLDGVLNLYIMTPEEICSWLDKIKAISENRKVNFEISLSINGDSPECFKPYL